MTSSDASAATEAFARHVHDALRHLYDTAELGASPLLRQLAACQPDATPADLRRLLIEAVGLLKPAADVPSQSSDWRYYRILYHRYIEQFPQQQVADNLALSIRQLRREEAEAVHVLAGCLRDHYRFRPQAAEGGAAAAAAGDGAPVAGRAQRDQELLWVGSTFPRELADIQDIAEAALATLEPLIGSSGVNVRRGPYGSLPRLFVQPASVQQALLNVLTVAVLAVPEGWVDISAQVQGREAWIVVEARPSRAGDWAPSGRDLDALHVARQLLALSRGELEVAASQPGGARFSATLRLPLEERAAVLVVDDNADALRLMERYISGTRYAFHGARSAEEALEAAAQVRPKAIILDIMLPGVDGWRLLGRLREHPQMQGVRLIVCSILPQDELALALGAAAFLRKPFTRQALLAVLDAAREGN